MAMLSMEKRLRGGAGTNLEGPLQGTSGPDKPLPVHSPISLCLLQQGPLLVHLVHHCISSTNPSTCGMLLALCEGKEALDEMDKWMDE